MSNPGVRTLTEKRISGRKPFRVEDNLGESIHIHYNDIRIDLTVKELLKLAEICDESIYDLIPVADFNLDDYDGDFLVQYARELYDLTAVSRESVAVSELYYLIKNKMHIPVRRHISKFCNQTEKTIDSKLPVIFNTGDTVVYGVSQAKNIYDHDPAATIEVLRLTFEKGKHFVSKHPWVPYFFKWDKKRFREFAYKIARKIL